METLSVSGSTRQNDKDPPMPDYRDKIRRQRPARALAADHRHSRADAVRLHCESCAASRFEARRCPAQKCFLWPYRPGKDNTSRDPGVVPTVEEYEALAPQLSEEEKERVRRQLRGT